MTVYELIKTHSHALRQLADAGCRVQDLEYMDMYSDYNRLVDEGHKRTYVVEYLAEQYGVDVRTVYRTIKRFSKTI